MVLDDLFKQSPTIILDGALATELEGRGANLNHPLWSAKLLAENPGLVKQVHYDYLLAGAQIITTASYQASFPGFERQGYTTQQAADFMRLSVALAVQARDEAVQSGKVTGRPLVAASVGPYGAYLADGSEYRGNYGLTVEELKDFHRPRIQVLAESGADLLACETVPCFEEGIALVELMDEFAAMPWWLSFSCQNAAQVCGEQPFAQCAALANQAPGMVAVGVNCTPPQYVVQLAATARSVTQKPIVAYPNKGEIWDGQHKCWLPASGHTNFVQDALAWQKAGAAIIGGCCRTTPGDIRELKKALQPN
jgi:homocysteine S-methyltransferase